MIQGLGGLMSLTGRPEGEEGAGPIKVGVALTDILTGLYSTVAILAALAYRDQTGVGQHVDMALLDVQVACLANQAMNYLTTGTPPRRLGNAHPNIVPYGISRRRMATSFSPLATMGSSVSLPKWLASHSGQTTRGLPPTNSVWPIVPS